MAVDYTRKVTHTYEDYKESLRRVYEKNGKFSTIVPKHICSPEVLDKPDGLVRNNKSRTVDDNFIRSIIPYGIYPVGGGSMFYYCTNIFNYLG